MALVLLAEFSTMTDLHRGREGQALQAVQHGDTAWVSVREGCWTITVPPFLTHTCPHPS